MTTKTTTDSGSLEWRLFVITALASVYVASWFAIMAPSPQADAQAQSTRAPRGVEPPAGWQIATPDRSPRAVRTKAPKKRVRVRTRSS